MISMEQQHAFLDLAKGQCWDEIQERLSKQPSLINAQPGNRWSALHQAAWYGNVDAVAMLLKHKADPGLRTRDGQTCVEVAPIGPVRALLSAWERRGNDPQVREEAFPESNEPEARCEDLEWFPELPPKPSQPEMPGCSLHTDDDVDDDDVPLLKQFSGLRMRLRSSMSDEPSDQEEAQRQLQRQAAMAHGVPNENKDCDIWHLVKEGNEQLVLDEVRRQPAVLHLRGPLGETPLHMLVLYRHFNLARRIAMAYPSLITDQYSSRQYHGENCLHIAIVLHNVGFVRFLLEMGSKNGLLRDLMAAKADGLFFAMGKPCYYGESPLGFATCVTLADVVHDMVFKYGASLEEVDSNGNNLLHLTVIHRLPEMYDALCRLWQEWAPQHAEDADVPLGKRKNGEGLIPVCLAAKSGFADMLDHMLQTTCETEWSFGPVTCILMPLDGFDHIPGTTLSALEHIIEEGHLDLVMLPLVQELLALKWKHVRSHFFHHLRRALAIACAFTVMVVIHPSEEVGAGSFLHTFRVLVHRLCLYSVCLAACIRYRRQSGLDLGSLVGHFDHNFWSLGFAIAFHVFQVLEFCGFAGAANSALALAALLVWGSLLRFLLGFSNTGHLVVMVWMILGSDLVTFAYLTSVFVMGFCLAVFISTTEPAERNPSLFTSHLFDFFHMIIAGFDKDAHQGKGSLVISLLIVYSIMATVLLLNILIAMMNDTYNRVSSEAQQRWQLERARIIVALERERSPEEQDVPDYWLKIDGQRFLRTEVVRTSWARS